MVPGEFERDENMSIKQITTCDHCAKEVQGEPFYATPLGAAYIGQQFHACSLEHLGIAVAKALGVPVDATTLALVAESNNRLEMARQATIELDAAKARIAQLELINSRIVQHGHELEEEIKALVKDRERLLSRPDAVETLKQVRGRIEKCGYLGTNADVLMHQHLDFIDEAITSLTGPKRPTKPAEAVPVLIACGDCGGTGILLSGQKCSDCKGSGYLK
jgi:hypothetical protein